jgi:hypothetical protein
MGWIRIKDEDGTFFAPDGTTAELLDRMDKVNEMATTIAVRGVGQASAVALGLQFLARDVIPQPTFWFHGLRRAKSNGERKKVAKAVAEWADGDSVAAHYGYGIDLFCSEDFGNNAGKTSVLHPDNRQWLSEEYGIQFATLAELATGVTT